MKSRSRFVDSVEEIFPLQTGNAGLMDLVFAEVLELNNFYIDKDGSTSAKVITPCHNAATDIIMPTSEMEKSVFAPRIVSSILEETESYNENVIGMAQSILPVVPSFEILPTVNMNRLEGVPNYFEIIQDLFKRRDLNPLNYTTIRTHVAFPIIPSNIDVAWKAKVGEPVPESLKG